LEVTAERLLAAARNAGDRSNALEAIFFLCASAVLGPVPVDEALSATERRYRPLAHGPVEEAAVEHMEGLLRGMRGEFDEGRRLIQKAQATRKEFGLGYTGVGGGRDEALIAHYEGDAAGVERVLRPACEQLRAAGDIAYLSVQIGELAEALYELGRYDEAEEASQESERLTQHADAASQLTWRRVRAKLLAHRGEGDLGLRLANEAIEWAEKTESLEDLANAYHDLAEVEEMVGHRDRAEEALERALALYEQKGIVPMAERMRGQLAELRASR
jgi:tetratricopeptide (TPR) repeat protein